ncbi:MAG: RNA-binding protein [Thermoplasmatales archaeon]|nr:RNA-binding protein [Thermoplasmatales archaeon]
MGFMESMERAREELALAENSRERAIGKSRALIRASKAVIHAVHSGADPTVPLESMESLFGDFPGEDARWGPVTDALAEYAEARILVAVAEGCAIPTWESLGVDPGAWAMGLADSVGEMRRLALGRLMAGDLAGAEAVFRTMETVADGLMLFDVPDAVVPLRRKQDVARGVVERTRSDLAVAKVMDG